MYCERCKLLCPDETLRAYQVHYGDRVGSRVLQEKTVQPNVYTQTRETSYTVAGSTSVLLCRGCVRRSRLRASLISLGLAVVAMTLILVFSYSVPPLSWVGLLLFLPAVIGIVFPLGKQWPARMAVDIVRKDKAKYGNHDSFWTDKDFSQLSRAQ